MNLEDIKSDGIVLNILQSSVDKNLFIFQGLKNTSWITTDCGELTSVIHHGSNILKYQFHPSQRTWILGLSKKTCTNDLEDKEKD